MIQTDTNQDTDFPLVSIVTIVYNGAQYLDSCIESVKAQTYKNLEYIIIDGGSTDGSLDICKKHSAIIAKLISEKDRGISDAFNKGIKLTTGRIVGILNADDSYRPDAIQCVVDCYLSTGKTEGVFYGDICYFNKHVNYELTPDLNSIWKYMSIYHPAVFVSKSVYDKVGLFSEDYRYAMDVEFIHRCLHENVPFQYVGSTLTNFRLGGTSGINYKGSYREFYESVKTYNNHRLAWFYYYLGITKKLILSSKFGSILQKNRKIFAPLMSGKNKPRI